MILHQYYRHQHLVGAKITDRAQPLDDDLTGLLNAYVHQTPLLHAETDGDYISDPANLLTSPETLARFTLRLTHPLDSIHSAIRNAKGLPNLATCEWASLDLGMVEANPASIHTMDSAKPLPYQGCFGQYGQPKRYHFDVMAYSPTDAWNKVTLSLGGVGTDLSRLTLFSIQRGTLPLHDLLTRHLPEVDGMADAQTARVWRGLCDQESEVIAKARDLPCHEHGFFPPDIAFIVREMMVRSQLLEQEAQVDYPRLADAIYRALSAGKPLAETPPVHVHQPLTFHDEHDMVVTPSADMFGFTPRDRLALTTPPDIRFLVMHNIPVDRDMTVREQQAWCDYYLTRTLPKTA